MITSSQAQHFAILLVYVWAAYFIYLWLFWSDAPGAKAGVKRYQIMADILKFKQKTRRLCVVHIRTSVKPKEMAILDNNKCELCEKKEFKYE